MSRSIHQTEKKPILKKKKKQQAEQEEWMRLSSFGNVTSEGRRKTYIDTWNRAIIISTTTKQLKFKRKQNKTEPVEKYKKVPR